MIRWWNDASIGVVDAVLGWLLVLPRDMALVLLSLTTVAILLLIRGYLSNQTALRNAARDERRLKQLIRAARQSGDTAQLIRSQRIRRQIISLRLRYELRPALLSLVPTAVLLTWGTARLSYYPPLAAEEISIVVTTPVSIVDRVVHMVPQPGIEPIDGWTRRVRVQRDTGMPYGVVSWRIRAQASPSPYGLVLRLGDRTVRHELLVGQPRYLAPAQSHGEQWSTRVDLREYKPFGFLPGVRQLGMPAWLVGYLALVIPAFLLIKRLARVA